MRTQLKKPTDEELLAQCQELDGCYAEAAAFDALHAEPPGDEEYCDESREWHKAALSRGSPERG
jgi:hypothetical protein